MPSRITQRTHSSSGKDVYIWKPIIHITKDPGGPHEFFDSFRSKGVTFTISRKLKDKFSISPQFNRNCNLIFYIPSIVLFAEGKQKAMKGILAQMSFPVFPAPRYQQISLFSKPILV